jgi:predicted RNA-binding Zn-ribbon protein involved in translation (DUF1610 family)
MNKFIKIINKALQQKCEKCGINEIAEGAVFNYCPGCFEEYVKKLEKERMGMGKIEEMIEILKDDGKIDCKNKEYAEIIIIISNIRKQIPEAYYNPDREEIEIDYEYYNHEE